MQIMGKWRLVPAGGADAITDDMLNAAQERLCERRNITYFEDDVEADKIAAAIDASPDPREDAELVERLAKLIITAVLLERSIVPDNVWQLVGKNNRRRCEDAVRWILEELSGGK